LSICRDLVAMEFVHLGVRACNFTYVNKGKPSVSKHHTITFMPELTPRFY